MATRKAKFKKGQFVKASISRNDSVVGKITSVTYVPWQNKYHYGIRGVRISDGYPWTITDIEESEIKAKKGPKFEVGQWIADKNGKFARIFLINYNSLGNPKYVLEYKLGQFTTDVPESFIKKSISK